MTQYNPCNDIKNDEDFLNYLFECYHDYHYTYDIAAYDIVKNHMMNHNMLRVGHANLDITILSVRECIRAIKKETDDYLPYVIIILYNPHDLSSDVLNYINKNSNFLNNLTKYREYLGAMEFLKEEGILNAYAIHERFIIYCISKFIENYMHENRLTLQSNVNALPNNPQSNELSPNEKLRVMKLVEMENEERKKILQRSESMGSDSDAVVLPDNPQSRKQRFNELITVKLLDNDFICPKCNRIGRLKILKNKPSLRHYYESGERKGKCKTDHIIKDIDNFLKGK